MTWGVFEIKDDSGTTQAIHVCPCDKTGRALPGHVLSPCCSCISRVERPGPATPPIFVHDVIH